MKRVRNGAELSMSDGDYRAIVNGLLAFPPYSPGIDVYDDGRLPAGYAYDTINECIDAMREILRTRLG